jgi:divalent metal cation (Fe/Co/Zn/Cd) transporter
MAEGHDEGAIFFGLNRVAMVQPVQPHKDTQMPKSSGSLKAVFYALGANGGIALAKGVAAFFTGSGAMLAEALHSFADCGNQVLLLVGMQQAKKLPTPDHPMGYGRVVYLWSMMVGVVVLSS